MRISDWSSDVCSSDLIIERSRRAGERSCAADRGEIGRLTVAFFGSSIYQAVPMILRRFRAQVPLAQIVLVSMGKDRQQEALRSGAIDIGFSRSFNPAPDIEVMKIGRAAGRERVCRYG